MTNDSMTRNYDGNRIVVIRHPDGPRCSRFSESLCDIPVSPRFAIGNMQKLMPDRQLKWRTFQVHREIELGSGPLKILVDLLDEHTVGVEILDSSRRNAATKMDRLQPAFGGRQG